MAILGDTKAVSLTLLNGVIGNLNPKITEVYTLGTSNLKWNNVYATSFTGNLIGSVNGNVIGNVTGNLTGNATTATTANGLASLVTATRANHTNDTGIYVQNTDTTNPLKLGYIIGTSGKGGIWDSTHNEWKVQIDPNGTTTFKGNLTGNVTGDVTGNISTAANAALTVNSGYTLYLNSASSTSIVFQKAQTEIARFDTSGHFVPKASSNYTIGTSSNKWSAVYATTFYGNLNGNATTATYLGNVGRLTSMNVDFGSTTYNSKFFISYADDNTSSTNKPYQNATVLNIAWDNNSGNKYGSQIAIGNSTTPHLQIRGCANGTWDANWITILDSSNYTNYAPTLSAATSDALGGVKIGYSASGKNYAVQLDSNSKMYVNVPWTDTNTKVNYTLTTTTKSYLMASSDAPTSTTTAREAKGDTGVYLTATAGGLSAVAHSFNISGTEKAYITYNSTDNCLDFIFI